MKALASRVRNAREKLGWSCAEVDRQAELSIGHTARIEAGGCNVTQATLAKVAKALGVSVGWLLK